MNAKRRQRTVYVITAAAMLAMIGGYALAATTITTLSPQQATNVTQSPTPGAFSGIATVTSEQLVVLSTAMATSGTAGTETVGATGLSGVPAGLATCAAGPCPLANFITASPATEAAANFGEQVVLNVTQPAGAGSNSVGFDMAITVSITVGISTYSVVSLAYLATGSTGVGTTSSISVFLFVDLGITTALTINSVNIVFNQCSSAAACP